jgi:hypothetical protein
MLMDWPLGQSPPLRVIMNIVRKLIPCGGTRGKELYGCAVGIWHVKLRDTDCRVVNINSKVQTAFTPPQR